MKRDSVLALTSPIILGFIPIGITFGLLGYQQGLSFIAVVSFSLFVFAGSSQFAVLGLMGDGITSLFSVFITVWLINLRHVVLSLAYLPYTKKWSWMQRLRFFPLLADEPFALLSMSERRTEPRFAWQCTLVAYFSWSLGTAIGFYFGSLFPDPKRLGLDFALSAMFLGIIVLYIKRREHVLTLSLAVLFTILFYFKLELGRASIILAAVLASFIGAMVEWKRSRS